ncbi:MAG: exodeoxyribonuclease V subunit alpha [Methyloprofundus sp.]|nr:exodeoxyribonuclease V subunit alpha [Methyloprofundus sp.]
MKQDDIQFSRLDYAFSQFLSQRSQLDKEQKKSFESIVLHLSNAQSCGHSCIKVDKEEQELLSISGLVDDSGTKPLVLLGRQLYLQRYWNYECQVAEKIIALTTVTAKVKNTDKLIEQYFPDSDDVDWQKEAAKAAIKNPFTIVTGGPGTGKTTTVVKILALLQELAMDASKNPLNIALAAPTGKAAMRLQESIGNSKQRLPSSALIKQLIPEKVVTLHRLLGAKPPSPYFRYNASTPLPYDIIVVDEVSMIDLALMSKLLSALKQNARLILLGDKDQLASVETGTVLADLSQALPAYTQELKVSYRFSGNIKNFADKVNAQDAESAWDLLQQEHADVSLLNEDVIHYIVAKQDAYLQLIKQGASFSECLTAFNAFQVLSATRKGLYSVEDINERVLQQLKDKQLIQASAVWYAGRPVMITQNDAVLQLYNGDVGLCMPDAENNRQLMVFFLLPDGSIRKYLPSRLSYCETVFAMTIHKSQGSEFDEVLLLLPEVMNPILTKELIYTGLTRAKKTLKVLSGKAVFMETLQRKVERFSGLVERIENSRLGEV